MTNSNSINIIVFGIQTGTSYKKAPCFDLISFLFLIYFICIMGVLFEKFILNMK